MAPTTARWMNIAALGLLAAGIGFFLLLGIGEMTGGEISGAQHLVEASLLGGLLWLAVRRPRTAGLVLLVLSVALALLVAGLARGEPVALLIMLPPALTGALLLLASRGRPGRPGIHLRSGHV